MWCLSFESGLRLKGWIDFERGWPGYLCGTHSINFCRFNWVLPFLLFFLEVGMQIAKVSSKVLSGLKKTGSSRAYIIDTWTWSLHDTCTTATADTALTAGWHVKVPTSEPSLVMSVLSGNTCDVSYYFPWKKNVHNAIALKLWIFIFFLIQWNCEFLYIL